MASEEKVRSATLDRLLSSISVQESDGDPNAARNEFGCWGKYQMTDELWKEGCAALSIDPSNTSEANQDLVARYTIGTYLDSYNGDARYAAAAWYANPAYASDLYEGRTPAFDPDLPMDASGHVTRDQDKAAAPSVNDYVSSVLGRMGETAEPLGKGGSGQQLNTSGGALPPSKTATYGSVTNTNGIITFAAFMENLVFFKRMQEMYDGQTELSLHAFIVQFLQKFYHNLVYIPTLPGNKAILVKPECLFVTPPHCNFIYPRMRISSQINRNIKAEPTRIMLISNPVNLMLGGQAKSMTNINTFAYVEYVSGTDGATDVIPFTKITDTKVKDIQVEPTKAMSKYEKKNGIRILKTEGGSDLYLFIMSQGNQKTDKDGRPTYSIKADANNLGKTLSNLARYSLLRTRYAQRGGSYATLFNPYVIPGFPFVNIEGVADSSLIVQGYVNSVNHTLTPSSSSTTIEYTAAHISATESKPNAFPIIEQDYSDGINATYKDMLGTGDGESAVKDIPAEQKWYAENGMTVSQLYERLWRPLTSLDDYLAKMADGATIKDNDLGYSTFEGKFFDTKVQEKIKAYTESVISGRAMATSDVY